MEKPLKRRNFVLQKNYSTGDFSCANGKKWIPHSAEFCIRRFSQRPGVGGYFSPETQGVENSRHNLAIYAVFCNWVSGVFHSINRVMHRRIRCYPNILTKNEMVDGILENNFCRNAQETDENKQAGKRGNKKSGFRQNAQIRMQKFTNM